jgi:hypothetical protein
MLLGCTETQNYKTVLLIYGVYLVFITEIADLKTDAEKVLHYQLFVWDTGR